MSYKNFRREKLRKYKLITVAMALACMTHGSAFAQNYEVSNATELKTALTKATAADTTTIIFKNDIDMSGANSIDLTNKNITIDGAGFGITSLRNFALLVKQKGNLILNNIGRVDNDYNVISSFNNSQDKQGNWGGPITTQNKAGTVTYDENSKLIINNSVFANNFAETDGGVIGLQTLDFDIQNSVFINNSSGQEGGAIWTEVNSGNIENCYFRGNFVRDKKANTSIGGAIANYSYYDNRPAYIDNISGTFIENYSYNVGGAIVNRQRKADATINKISGTFNSNYSIQTGGAIVNAAGTINSIDGTFTKNYLLNTNTSTGSVSGATLLKLNESLGGAISNTNTGGGNEATTVSHIKSITGEFIGNFINTKNGKAYGGAIYNAGVIDEISGTFKDNYVYTEGTAANLALGGAIYSTRDLTITSGKNGTLFSGNYSAANTQERNYNAIYMGSADATLNLIPKSGKTIQFDDNIDGVSGYKVNIKSENGGTLKLYNDIKNANITTGDVNIDLVDTKFHDYDFLSLNSSAATNYIIDFKIGNPNGSVNVLSDTIKVGSSSSGVITLSDINFIADTGVDYKGKTFTQRIISGSDDIELALGANLKQSQQKVISTVVDDVINPITQASDIYYKKIYTGQLTSQIALTKSTTSTKYDTISITVNNLIWNQDEQKKVLGDTFALWLGLETSAEKEFRIAANQQYKVTEVLNPVPAGKLSIVGESNVSSVFDADNKALFYLDKASDLTLDNVRIISAKSDSGSVIKAVNPTSSITIENGSFINNVAALFGGVISNASKLTNNIKGIFTGNTAGSSGGAIFNQGNINSISGEYNANHTTNSWATGKVSGGAIANKGGTIESINADFTSNYSDQWGGAIANVVENGVSSTINSITGNFNDNYIVVNNSEAYGGAIYNNGTISTIAGNFIHNYVDQKSTDAIKAYGGAIYNAGSNLTVSGQFVNNYLSVASGSNALGGAIYTTKDMTVSADNGQNTLFKGNYVQVGNTKNDNAIYVDNVNATLTLKATNGGVISLYDNIDGAISKATDENTGKETITGCYKVQMTGDSNGVIGLYNDINNANVIAENVTISLADGNTRDYTFYDLKSSGTSKWNIDVDLTNGTADTITTLSGTSTGTIMINNFNIIGSTSKASLTIQILKNTSGNNNLQLAINPNSLVADVSNIGNEVLSSKSYLKQDGGIALGTTQTENDSIKILKDGLYDALKLINDKDTTEERKFTFDTAGTHSLIEDLGETKAGTLSINGYSNDSSVSVVDLAGKTGFKLTNGNTAININNATLTDSSSPQNPLITVKNADNTINLNNAQLNGKIEANSNYDLNLSGNKVNILGTVDMANAKLNDALTTLTFNTDTFSNATLYAVNGIINLQNSAIENYNIGTLKSEANTLYNIDVDAYNKTADKITAGVGSEGTVTINSINFLNGIKPQDKDFKVQILDPTSSTLKLALSNEITSQLYDFETITEIDSKDTITPTVNFDEKFYQSDKEYLIKGHLSVLDDDVYNSKFIGFKDDEFQKVLISVSNKKLLNSLSELCSLEATGKVFTFDNATTKEENVYGVISDIGTVVNDLTINGKAFGDTDLSVIGIDNNKGFELGESSKLTLSRVTLNGSVSNPVIINNGGTVKFDAPKNIINGLITGNGTGTVINSGMLYISASNLGVNIVNNHELYLSDGVLNSEITETGNGITFIDGVVTNNAKIAQKVNVNGNGSLTVGANIGDLGNSGSVTANVENLTGDIFNATGGILTLSGTLDSTKTRNVENDVDGTILFSGKLDRTIAGGGVTMVNNELTLGKNAGIAGSLNLNGGTINTIDGEYTVYDNINQITGSGSAKIDIDWVNQKSDTFNCKEPGGIISLIVDTSSVYETKEIKNITNGNVGIAIGNTTPDVKELKTESSTALTDSVNWTDKFGTWSKTDTYTGTLTAYKSSEALTVNDSIRYEVTKEEGAVIYNPDKDTLALITTSQIADNPDKSFTTNDASAVYTVKEDLGTLKDNLTISGKINEENAKISTINVGEKAGITIAGNNSLTVKDVKVTSSGTFIDATSNLAKITLDNAQVLADISSAGKLDITNQTEVRNLTASGNTTVDSSANLTVSLLNNSGTFENNGSLYATDKIMNSGTITTDADNITADNGIINNNKLTLNNGVLSSHVAGSGTTEILGTVTNNATISQNVTVKENASLNVGANIGNLINEGDVSADANYLTGTVNNSGTIALSGTLDKNITGNGTTIISNNELTLSDGAAIEGTLNINNATLNILSKNTTNIFNNVSINSGTLNLINDSINNLSASSFNLTGDVNLLVDADLANSSMDRLPVSTTISNGMINIQGINLISDSKELKTYVPFAYDSFKTNVKTDITEIGSGVNNRYQTTTYAPIYKYDVSYNPESGSFLFSRGGGSSSGDFNPAVLPSAVNSQAGAYTAMNETFNYAFRHADYSFMPLPKRIRSAMTNRYAINALQSLPYETEYSKSAGIWYQPYVNFENMHLSNGPRVDIQSYGSLVGADSEFKYLKHGWGTVTTPYIGYNGSSQHYAGVSTYTNGGILGLTQTFYKNNFFTAITVNAGANVGEANTMYGHENFTTLMAGVASKTGYNFEFNDGKFIIQPNYMMSYSFINTFDYTNAAGVRIDSDPLHTIQIHPTIKFIGNLKNGWQPYASVGMVWNLLNETKVTANNAALPQMSIKPYVEYGLGIQKTYKDKFTGFAQAMVRNGGRNGIALSFGFKWAIGKEPKPVEKVQVPAKNGVSQACNNVQPPKKVVIKQLNRG